MKNFEFSKLDMYLVVLLGFKENKSIWEGNVYFAGKVAALQSIVKAIGEAYKVQMRKTKGTTVMKNEKRIALRDSSMMVIRIMRCFAASTDNNILYDEMHHTPSGLKKSTATKLLFDTGIIHEKATANKADAAAYGLTQGLLDDLAAKNLDFSKWINAPAVQQNLKKDATATIKKLFKEADEVLEVHLDNAIGVYIESNPIFYNTHFGCRVIIDSPTTKLAMRCKIVDSDTKMPIVGAKVVIKDHDINRKSTPKGQLLVRNLKEGNHTVTVSLEGYAPQAVKATYKTGETTFVTIEMVKA